MIPQEVDPEGRLLQEHTNKQTVVQSGLGCFALSSVTRVAAPSSGPVWPFFRLWNLIRARTYSLSSTPSLPLLEAAADAMFVSRAMDKCVPIAMCANR